MYTYQNIMCEHWYLICTYIFSIQTKLCVCILILMILYIYVHLLVSDFSRPPRVRNKEKLDLLQVPKLLQKLLVNSELQNCIGIEFFFFNKYYCMVCHVPKHNTLRQMSYSGPDTHTLCHRQGSFSTASQVFVR